MISIIIPVFEVQSYIRQCLESVANQTYKDIEVIIVDDCGKDDSMQVVESFVEEYKGPIAFKIVRHSYNRGLSAARNTGLSVAKGEYISFIDSDDYIAPETYAIMKRHFDESSSDVGIVICGIYADVEGRFSDFYKAPMPFEIMPCDFADYLLNARVHVCACAKLYKSNIFSDVRFREGYRNEDVMFAFDIYKDIENKGVVTSVIPEQLYYYRQHSGSICHDSTFILDELNNLEEIMRGVKMDKPALFIEQRYRYLDYIVRAALDAKMRSSAIHKEYRRLCRKLRSIPDSLAKMHFSRERYKRFLLLKYFFLSYEVICNCCLMPS